MSDYYEIGGRSYPRVSRIYGIVVPYWLQQWKDRVDKKTRDKTSKPALNTGSATHDWVDRINKGLVLDKGLVRSMPKSVAWGVLGYRRFLKVSGYKVQVSEMTVYSKKYNYAGTLDSAGYMNGHFVIGDYKTSKSLSDKRYNWQVGAYAKAYEEMTNKRPKGAFILRLPKKYEKKPYEYKEVDLEKGFKSFKKALDLYNEVENG